MEGQLCQGRRTAGGQKSRQGSGDKKRGHREAQADWDQWVGPDRLLAYDLDAGGLTVKPILSYSQQEKNKYVSYGVLDTEDGEGGADRLGADPGMEKTEAVKKKSLDAGIRAVSLCK